MIIIPLKPDHYERAKPFEKWWKVFKRDYTCNAPLETQDAIRALARDVTGITYNPCCHGTFIDALQSIFRPFDKFKQDEILTPNPAPLNGVQKNKGGRPKKQQSESTANP